KLQGLAGEAEDGYVTATITFGSGPRDVRIEDNGNVLSADGAQLYYDATNKTLTVNDGTTDGATSPLPKADLAVILAAAEDTKELDGVLQDITVNGTKYTAPATGSDW